MGAAQQLPLRLAGASAASQEAAGALLLLDLAEHRLGGFRRLRIRYERSSERFYALVLLACSVICFNALQQPPW